MSLSAGHDNNVETIPQLSSDIMELQIRKPGKVAGCQFSSFSEPKLWAQRRSAPVLKF